MIIIKCKVFGKKKLKQLQGMENRLRNIAYEWDFPTDCFKQKKRLSIPFRPIFFTLETMHIFYFAVLLYWRDLSKITSKKVNYFKPWYI